MPEASNVSLVLLTILFSVLCTYICKMYKKLVNMPTIYRQNLSKDPLAPPTPQKYKTSDYGLDWAAIFSKRCFSEAICDFFFFSKGDATIHFKRPPVSQ